MHLAETRRHVPIDGPDLVPGSVLADFLEVHAAALEDALVLAGKRGRDKAARL